MEPKTPAREPTPLDLFRDKVRAKYKDMSDVPALAKEMARIEDLLEKSKEETSRLNCQWDVLRLEVLPDRMDAQGIENIAVDGVGKVSLTADLYVSIKPDSKSDLFKWFRKNKLGELIKETVHSGTMRSFVKSWMKDPKKAAKLPSALLNVTPYTRASITKA